MRVIVAGGLAGLTHRAVADEAKVPLGSTTYYFADRNDLLVAAMEVAIKVERRLIARYVESNDGTLRAAPRDVHLRANGQSACARPTARGVRTLCRRGAIEFVAENQRTVGLGVA